MKESITLRLIDAKKTTLCGASLASTLYSIPVDVFLSGPVGAGKTCFVQGFAHALGIIDHVQSPTYALERHYKTTKGYPLLHMDLYRIPHNRMRETLAQSDHHEGIRCIEWADRMHPDDASGLGTIHIMLSEIENERMCSITFDDVTYPSYEDILQWRNDAMLPVHIQAHSDAVAKFSVQCAELLMQEGILIRPLLLQRAGELHDLFRFIDFRPGAAPAGMKHDEKSMETWEQWKKHFPGMRHEAACATFLREKKYEALARIIEVHGLQLPSPERATIEQKLLFYADKRMNGERIVSIDERFTDFMHRYSDGVFTSEAKIWHAEAKKIEHELFPNGAPFS